MSSITTANNANDDNSATAPATPVEEHFPPNNAATHEVGHDNQEPWGFVNQPQAPEDVNEDENTDVEENRENEPPEPNTTATNQDGHKIGETEEVDMDISSDSGEVGTPLEERESDSRFYPALQLREVLEVILAHLDNSTTASAAQVSSYWSDVALDTLFKRSPELYDLVSILAPIQETSFSRELVPSDWQRFNHYAYRVHTLSHDTTGSMSGRHLSETVFQELSLSRPNLKMLPNLRTFTWTASRPRFLRASLLFLHDTLTSLTLRIARSDGAKCFESYLKVLAERTPYLDFFELDCPRAVSEYEEPFCGFLSKLRKLTTIVLPHFFLTTNVVAVLSNLPLLESIALRKGDHIGDSKDMSTMRLPTSPDMFPSIKRLSLDTNLHEIQNFFTAKLPHSFTHIQHLHVSSLSLESPNEIHNFLTMLPRACPRVSSLMLALLSLSVPNPSHGTEVTLETLRPLFSLPHLVEFGITYNYPLKITQDDCEVLAKGLANLRTLYLCESSYDTHDRGATNLSLASLVPFALHCHKLEQLGLFMDAAPAQVMTDDAESPGTPAEIASDASSLDTTQYPSLSLPNVTTPFKKLQTLSVGQSFLPSTHIIPTSLFLSQLLPPNCTFQTGCTDKPHCFSPTYHEASPHPESDDAFQTRLNQWAEVKKLVPTLQSIRLKERERAMEAEREKNALREELESLRKELELLRAGRC